MDIKFSIPMLVCLNIWVFLLKKIIKFYTLMTNRPPRPHMYSKIIQMLLFEYLGTPRTWLWLKEIIFNKELENMYFFENSKKNSFWSDFFLHWSALNRPSSCLGDLYTQFKCPFKFLTSIEAETRPKNWFIAI